MAILEEEVEINLVNRIISYYENLGYKIPRYKYKDGNMKVKIGTKILVKVEDLSIGSNIKLTVACDELGCENITSNKSYAKIIIERNNYNGLDLCYCCVRKRVEKKKKENADYNRSLECYAKKYNKEYLLQEFSFKNNTSPDKIYKSSNDNYLWKCSKCDGEYEMQANLRTRENGSNCPYCAGKRILKGYNDLWTTHPHVAEMLKYKDRGYEITAGRGTKEDFCCLNCSYTEKKSIQKVVERGFSCPKCSDGVSYPEKFMFNVLDQLNVKFEKEKSFEWSKSTNSHKVYDFFIESLNCIIETHGRQHYSYTGFFKTLETEKNNDILKEDLANKNGISHYIVIDCAESNMFYIKNNIISSRLNSLLDLSKVDWLKCHKYSTSSLVKTACDLWNSGIRSTIEIEKIIGVVYTNVSGYLKQGSLLGWCDYDPKEVMVNIGKSNGRLNGKPIVQLTLDNQFVKRWESAKQAANELNINSTAISSACQKTSKSSGGYKWMHENDYERNKDNLAPYTIKRNNKPVVKLDLYGNFLKLYNSIKSASEDTGISKSNISTVCRKKRELACGFRWMYKEDYEKQLNELITKK